MDCSWVWWWQYIFVWLQPHEIIKGSFFFLISFFSPFSCLLSYFLLIITYFFLFILFSYLFTIIQTIPAHAKHVRGIIVHPSLPLIISCSSDSTIKIFNYNEKWNVEKVGFIILLLIVFFNSFLFFYYLLFLLIIINRNYLQMKC